jgi:hypothetical protein
MRLLLAYLFLAVGWGMWAARRDRPIKPWGPLAVAAVVALGYLSRRIIS